jgi:hypothetical protein
MVHNSTVQDLWQFWLDRFLSDLSQKLGGLPSGLTLLNYEDMTFRTYLRPSRKESVLTIDPGDQQRIQVGLNYIKSGTQELELGAGEIAQLYEGIIHHDLRHEFKLTSRETVTAASLLARIPMPPFCLLSGAFFANYLDIDVLPQQTGPIKSLLHGSPPYCFSQDALKPFFHTHPAYERYHFKRYGYAELYEFLYSLLTSAPKAEELAYWAQPIFAGGIYRGLLFTHCQGSTQRSTGDLKRVLRIASGRLTHHLPYLDLAAARECIANEDEATVLDYFRALSVAQPLCFGVHQDESGKNHYFFRSTGSRILRRTDITEVVRLRMLPLEPGSRKDDEILIGNLPSRGDRIQPETRLHSYVLASYFADLKLKPSIGVCTESGAGHFELYYAGGKGSESKTLTLELQVATLRPPAGSARISSAVGQSRVAIQRVLFTLSEGWKSAEVSLDANKTLVITMIQQQATTLDKLFQARRIEMDPQSSWALGGNAVKWDRLSWIGSQKGAEVIKKGRLTDFTAITRCLWHALIASDGDGLQMYPQVAQPEDVARRSHKTAFQSVCKALNIEAASIFKAGAEAFVRPTVVIAPSLESLVFEDGRLIPSVEYRAMKLATKA